jgi:hypothetical protein
MRPCNQCRQPIENSLQLCDECEQYNRDHGVEAKPPVSMSPFDPNDLKPVPLDASLNVMLLMLGFCCACLGLLIGMLFGNLTYALVGFVVGWVAAAMMVPMFR